MKKGIEELTAHLCPTLKQRFLNMDIIAPNNQPVKTRAEYIALAQQRADLAFRSHDTGQESFHLTYAHLYATLALSAPEIVTPSDPYDAFCGLLYRSEQFGGNIAFIADTLKMLREAQRMVGETPLVESPSSTLLFALVSELQPLFRDWDPKNFPPGLYAAFQQAERWVMAGEDSLHATDADVGGELAVALADQATKTADLIDALRRYGQHERGCDLMSDPVHKVILSCTCGLNDALLAAQMPTSVCKANGDPNAP
jgi:hypothetical protein